MDAFSMQVNKPEPGDPERAERIRASATSYVTASKDMAAGNAEADKKVGEFHKGMADLNKGQEKAEGGQAKTVDKGAGQPSKKKNKGRSRNPKPPQGGDAGGVSP